MKKIIYIVWFVLCSVVSIHGQGSLQSVLESIEQNNTQLKALREMSTAEKLENKTANNLANPEVEFTHKPASKGEFAETGIEATQSFDFPTAYKYRGELINMQNKQVDLAYDVKRKDVLKEARTLLMDYIHQSKLLAIIEERTIYARELYTAYQNLFDRGDINILERNKTKLNLLEAEKDLQLSVVDVNSIKTELQRMNGGEPVSSLPANYGGYQLPLDFETWFQGVKYHNPALLIAEKNVDISRKQEQLARSLNLPKLNAGYVGDLMRSNNRHGFLVSVSIPLWEGKNTVKSKKAQTVAMQYEREDAEHQYKNELKVSYEKAQKLAVLLKEYSEIIDNSNNFLLLKKSFDMGQMSLIEYLQELIIYHQAVDNYLATEKDYNLALSDLEQWEN